MKVIVYSAIVLLLHLPLARSSVFIGLEHLDTSHASSTSFPGVYLKPYSPRGDISCGQNSCAGEFQTDLSSDSSIKFQWSADKDQSKGVIIDVDPRAENSVIDFEFNAGYDCDENYYQFIHGSSISWSFDALSNGKYAYDPNKSLIEIGKCVGCTRCEIFVRLRFNYDGGLNMNFISLTAEANYDSSSIPPGPKVYDWTTENWSDIRFRFLSFDEVSFSTYDLPTPSTSSPTESPVDSPTQLPGPSTNSPTKFIAQPTGTPTQLDLVKVVDSTSSSSYKKSLSFLLIGTIIMIVMV